jgi:hypothetical protein
MASSAIIVICLMTSGTTLAWSTPITRVSTLSCTRRFSRTTTTTTQQQHLGLRMSESSNDDNGPTFDEREQPSDPSSLQKTNNNKSNRVSFDDAGRELVQQEDLARLEESGDFDTNPAVRLFVRLFVVLYTPLLLLLLLLLLYSYIIHLYIIHVYVYSTRVTVLKK